MAINAKAARVLFPSSFSTSSGTYVNLLNGSGGSVISVTLTKAAGTDIYIKAGATAFAASGTPLVTLGVNDGSTDYPVGRSAGTTSDYFTPAGAKVISGLPAGTYTFTLRVKVSGGTVEFNANLSAFIMAMEVSAQSRNVKAVNHQYSSTFSLSSSSYADVLKSAGGSPVDVSITKGAGTSLLVIGECTAVQNASNATLTLGVNDGTTDHDLARCRMFATAHHTLVGAAVISGLGAGSHTLKLRAKQGAVQTNFTAGLNFADLMVMEIDP